MRPGFVPVGVQWTGHVGIALLVYAPLAYTLVAARQDATMWLALAALVPFALAPDVDLYVAGLAHRGPTHTVWAVLACGVAGAVLGRVALDRRMGTDRLWFGGVVGVLGAGSHLVGDVLTPMGLAPFAPGIGATYSLDLVLSGNAAVNDLLFGAGVTLLAVAAGRSWVRGRPARPTARDRS